MTENEKLLVRAKHALLKLRHIQKTETSQNRLYNVSKASADIIEDLIKSLSKGEQTNE